MVVQNSDEPNGRIRKKHHQLNKSQQQSLNNVQGGPAPTRYKQGYSYNSIYMGYNASYAFMGPL